MGIGRLRRIVGRAWWRMDRHGLFLRGRVDGLRDRVGELEQAVLVRNGRTNERLLALELEITGAELTPVAGEVEAGLLLRDRPVDGDERIARLEARLAQLEARLEEQGAGRAHDDERLDDFLVLVGCAFESLALGSERLRFKNPR